MTRASLWCVTRTNKTLCWTTAFTPTSLSLRLGMGPGAGHTNLSGSSQLPSNHSCMFLVAPTATGNYLNSSSVPPVSLVRIQPHALGPHGPRQRPPHRLVPHPPSPSLRGRATPPLNLWAGVSLRASTGSRPGVRPAEAVARPGPRVQRLPITWTLQMAHVSHSTSQLHMATAFHFLRENILSPPDLEPALPEWEDRAQGSSPSSTSAIAAARGRRRRRWLRGKRAAMVASRDRLTGHSAACRPPATAVPSTGAARDWLARERDVTLR